MKVKCKIRVFDDDVGRECFAKLVALCPEAIHNGVLRLSVPPDHPAIPKVIEVLRAHGLTMRSRERIPARREFIDIKYEREFEEEDFASARYLLPVAEDTVASGESRTPDGNLTFGTEYLTKRFRVASVGDDLVVTAPVRDLFDRQGFKHLLWRRCQVVGDGAEDYEDFPIWELTSDLVLPAASPACKFCDCEGGDDFTNPDKGRTLDEGLHVPALFRYRAEDLRAVEPFDVAVTREPLGFKLTHHPLIVSQRFYRVCQAEKFKLWWFPVVVEED